MIKVGSEIVKRQKLFLEKGTQYIKPMVLKDIAEAVGMHESTISRVTTGSLIQTPQGTLELKAFFSVGLQQDNDDGSTSATSIKFKIKKLIIATELFARCRRTLYNNLVHNCWLSNGVAFKSYLICWIYFLNKGANIVFVSGSNCHIMILARI